MAIYIVASSKPWCRNKFDEMPEIPTGRLALRFQPGRA